MNSHNWVWFWRTDEDTWKLYDVIDAMEIRQAEVLGRSTVSLQEGHYLLNFGKLVQINQITGFQRAVDRAEADSIWIWKDVDEFDTSNNCVSWNAYDLDDAEKLTGALARKEENVVLERRGMVYFIDLINRTQTNIDTGRCRDLRRGKPPEYDLLLPALDVDTSLHESTLPDSHTVPSQTPVEFAVEESVSSHTPGHPPTPSHPVTSNLHGCEDDPVQSCKLRSNRSSISLSESDAPNLVSELEPNKREEKEGDGSIVDSEELIKATHEKKPDFFCRICKRIMRDPVLTWNGESYDRRCIENWFCENDRDFITNEQLSTDHKRFITNYAFKHIIEAWRDGEYKK